MKEQIKKMKQELKELASRIKENKKQRKSSSNGYVAGLAELKLAFRHKHVAYCLARGRTLEQVDSGRRLNMEYVKWVLSSMREDSKEKLYVVVNDKLSPSQQAVQSGHAVAEFLKVHPNTQWSNGYLIYLKDSPDRNGDMSPYWWLTCGIHQCAKFREPDVGNKITAYACFGPDAERMLKNHKLV